MTDSQRVQPAQSVGGREYFSESQIDKVWTEVTKHFPEPLPSGYAFPTTAPAFFHPGTPHPMFQAGLPDEFAAQFWRCAWLAKASTDAPTNTAAENSDHSEMARFASLPSVSANLNVSAYNQLTASYAKAKSVSADQAEYALQCSGFTTAGGTK
ncbi:hypothetical protein [Leifsonia sp. EB34]|uniref:hypothetical protein n=1 Tax=Leifsonia sp. EB34 TaxID=3156303 RepID=UPI00351725F7